jgi:hypothetical protein
MMGRLKRTQCSIALTQRVRNRERRESESLKRGVRRIQGVALLRLPIIVRPAAARNAATPLRALLASCLNVRSPQPAPKSKHVLNEVMGQNLPLALQNKIEASFAYHEVVELSRKFDSFKN